MPQAELMRLRSRAVDEVETTWQRFVPSARLQRADPRDFAFEWTSIGVEGFSVVDYSLTAAVHSEIDPSTQLMACRLESATARLEGARGSLDASQPWLAVDAPVSARWAGTARVRALIFDLAGAQQVARTISGDDRLVLRAHGGAPRSASLARQWERTFAHVRTSWASVASSTTSGDALVEAELRRHALVTTLAAFSSTFTDAADRAAQARPAPATVRRAIAYLESHAHETVTLEDVAEAAGISTRGLQYAFRRALGITPMQYLRRVRLDGAHRELGGGAAPTVAEVARRWGFADASRFAVSYRAVYGRSPGATRRGA